MIKEFPMLMQSDMVGATLRKVNPKTNTRRTTGLDKINKKPNDWEFDGFLTFGKPEQFLNAMFRHKKTKELIGLKCPYGKVNDKIWIRENFWVDKREPKGLVIYAQDPRFFKYKSKNIVEQCQDESSLTKNYYTLQEARSAVEDNKFWTKKPSIHMFRWASRITLEITGLRAERVCSISDKDAIAEGIEPKVRGYKNYWSECKEDDGSIIGGFYSPGVSFYSLWDSINYKRGLGTDINPWVWVIEFKLIKGK